MNDHELFIYEQKSRKMKIDERNRKLKRIGLVLTFFLLFFLILKLVKKNK